MLLVYKHEAQGHSPRAKLLINVATYIPTTSLRWQ